MAGKNGFKAQQFIDAIPGTGGIIRTIANRVGCCWHTAKKYIYKYPTITIVYNDECETMLDLAESKILAAVRDDDIQTTKWFLGRKGAHRGWAEKREVDVKNTGDFTLRVVYDERIDNQDETPAPEAAADSPQQGEA